MQRCVQTPNSPLGINLIDLLGLKEKIHEECAALPDPLARRHCIIRHLRAAKNDANQRLEAYFFENPMDSCALIRAQSRLTDQIVTLCLDVSLTYAPPPPEPFAIVAVGGYGRAEMAPFSDVDLLFLTSGEITPWVENLVETILYILWDLKLKVGHAARSIGQCLDLAQSDISIRTALLEQRFIAGDHHLALHLEQQLWQHLFAHTGTQFIEAKLQERAARHKRQGGKRYVLEPNIKEGKGGLRDLQTLYWIGKYLHRVFDTEGLVHVGLLAQDEYNTFCRAEDFLWAIRCHLHYICKRAADQLTFDMQVEVAARMGYKDHDGRRAVEWFMQDYFRHATKVGELTRLFLTQLEALHASPTGALAELEGPHPPLSPGFCLTQNRINAADPARFLADKLNFLRVFEEALRSRYLLHPNIMRIIAANLHHIDDDMRNNPEAQRIFMDLLLCHGNPERALRRMNELGVLSAFIPEFEPIVAMMQFNVYHHYTVDEHTIQCISTLAQIERGELVEELPLSSAILQSGVNRPVLYAALLLHDIGKGRREDHSILGAQIARRVAPRLGLNPEECETVEWLVRYHLLMSDMVQKRDIGDPRTMRDFAKAVKTRKRLDLLTILTVCDIRGVGPKTWNNWKAMQLRQFHHDTAAALENGLESINREQREHEAKQRLAQLLSSWNEADLQTELGRHYPPYWQGLLTETQAVFAALLRDLPENDMRIDLHPDPDRDATRACFALADHPGIFSRLAGALALVQANIIDARTYTSKDGYATAVFWVQDHEGRPYEQAKLPKLRKMIAKILNGDILPREALAGHDKVKKREREFRFPTHITFNNDGSDIYTIIEVDTRDRPGLLYDLTRTLAASNISIVSAVIATYGAQVVDSFYVKDLFGFKLYAQNKQDALEKKLRQAIQDGAERAKS